MDLKAIVYTSNTGHTAAYAKLLSQKSGLPCYELQEAKEKLSKKDPVLYMGWLIAGFVKDYKKAKRFFDLKAVCAVGLGDSGAQTASVRKTNKIPESAAVFTLQGGMDYDKLTGIYKSMIDTLIKVLSSKKNPSCDEVAMLALLRKNDDYVCQENLKSVAAYFDW